MKNLCVSAVFLVPLKSQAHNYRLALCSMLLPPYYAQNYAGIIILSLIVTSDDTMTTSYIVSAILALFQL